MVTRAVVPVCSRPRTVDDISYQDDTVRTLRSTLETGQMQHLLFYGPPGTGKTSTILALARDLFGCVPCDGAGQTCAIREP